jgi:hypothetical protein
MALGALGNLGDLRAWWLVLRQALRMAPHPAAAPGAGEAAVAAYLPKVLALVASGQWLSERVGRIMRDSIVAPMLRVRDWAAEQGIVLSPEFAWSIDLALRGPTAPEGLTPVIAPWVIVKGFEAAILCGGTLLAARLLRPRIPARPALALGLAALATSTLYAMLLGVLVFRLEDALGLAAAVSAAVGPDGAPSPDFLPAVRRMIMVFGGLAVLGTLPLVAIVLCLARGLRRAGRRRAKAAGVAVLIALLTALGGVLSHRSGLGAALIRLFSF